MQTGDDDRTILEAYRRTRDEAAFAAIVARYGAMVVATARRQVRDSHQADDVTQAVFLVLARRVGSIDLSRGSLGGWLHRTTILTARNANRIDARRRRREREVFMRFTREPESPELATAESRIDPATLAALDEAIEALGRRDRDVISLRYFEQLEITAVADRLHVKESAAKKRLTRAITRLRQAFVGRVAPDIATALGAIALPPDVASTVLRVPTPAAQSLAKGTLTMMKQIAIVKASAVAASIAMLLAAGGVIAIARVQPSGNAATAATSPANDKTAIELAWDDLAKNDPLASAALLKLAAKPDEAVALLGREMQPVELSAAELDQKLAALQSDEEKVWKPAVEYLRYHDPRLARGLKALMDEVVDEPARGRLVSVLSGWPEDAFVNKVVILRGVEEGYNFFMRDPDAGDNNGSSFWAEAHVERLNAAPDSGKATWTRAVRGIVLLEDIGSPAARAIVEKMATGHPDAQPTRVAKEFIAKRNVSR